MCETSDNKVVEPGAQIVLLRDGIELLTVVGEAAGDIFLQGFDIAPGVVCVLLTDGAVDKGFERSVRIVLITCQFYIIRTYLDQQVKGEYEKVEIFPGHIFSPYKSPRSGCGGQWIMLQIQNRAGSCRGTGKKLKGEA